MEWISAKFQRDGVQAGTRLTLSKETKLVM
jgi:hypothetical protein